MFERINHIVVTLLNTDTTMYSHQPELSLRRTKGQNFLIRAAGNQVLVFNCPFEAARTFVRIELKDTLLSQFVS